MHNEKFGNYSPDDIMAARWKRMRWLRHVECRRRMRNAYINLTGKSDGKRSLGTRRRRWDENRATRSGKN
jgi:hypothetical protein